MSKTAPLYDDTHALIVDKQIELKKKHKISVKIADVIDMLVKNNIHKIGEYIGFKSDDDTKKDTKDNVKQNGIEGEERVVRRVEKQL